jgi:hypothetical protein
MVGASAFSRSSTTLPANAWRWLPTRPYPVACRARARGDRRTAWPSDDKMMREFIPWRRDYYANFDKLPKNAKRHPTDKTLQWDIMLGKAIVKWAAEQGLRGKQPAITATFTPKKKRVRPAFERWEYRLPWRTLCKRIKTARDKRTRASRELLRVYVLVLANSVIRTGEASIQTNWNNVGAI